MKTALPFSRLMGLLLAATVGIAPVFVSSCSDDDSPGPGPDLGAPGDDPAPEADAGDAPAPRDLDSGQEDLDEPADLPEDGGPDADEPSPDVAPEAEVDSGPAAADADADADPEPDECSESRPFDYSCDPADPDSCPGGLCILGGCIGPILDPHRWDACGDEVCDRCETVSSCPADCAEPPEMSGAKDYDNETTITLWVHGFSNKSPEDFRETTYGADRSCGGTLEEIESYLGDRPCGDQEPAAPNQLAKVEYYGAIPAGWMSEEQVAEVEQYTWEDNSLEALDRYALIVAKFARHKLEISGATHVNLCCHSMGCLICRHMIEHNLEGLAAENRFVRWATSTGVLAGARLARLYDNPQVRDIAELIGLELSDFVIMHPDYVQDRTTVWDHRLWEGNSPFLRGTIIHHTAATDPRIEEALGIRLLDLNNPEDLPNDGIMYTDDERFHRRGPSGGHTAPDGRLMEPTFTLVHQDHMNCPDSDSAGLMAWATLFNRRKVYVKLVELWIQDGMEGLLDPAPSEIALDVEVRYNPYVLETFGRDILVHDDQVEYRSASMWVQAEGEVRPLEVVVFSGPVPDEMDSLRLDLVVLEVDYYPRYQVMENVFDIHEEMLSFHGQVALENGVVEFSNERASAVLSVEMVEMY